MIKKLRCSLLSNDEPQDENVMWIDTSNPESFTLKLFRNGDWKPLHVVGTTRDMIERELTGYVTSHYHSYDKIINKPTTLTGYGITDCFNKTEIENLLNKKVTKVSGKSLSTNDFNNKYKKILDELPISYYNKNELDNLFNDKQDIITDLNNIREGAEKGNNASNILTDIVEAGYVFAGVATPTTNPDVPDTKVFYIANGKGTYEKFGGINVTEDDVVVLYWDTAWHKVATGIASQEKLSELERELLDQDENYVSGYRLLSGYDDQVADAEWMYTKDYVPAKKGDVVIWNPNLIKSGASIQYYDENKNYLFYATANALTRTITIEAEGTAYIRASFSLASKQDAKLIVNDVVVWTPKERNNGKIGQLNDLVNKLEQDVVDVKNEHSDVTLFATHGLVFPNCFDITPIYGKYKEGRLINGVINQTVSSTMSYDGYIPIVKGKLITVMALKIQRLLLNTLSFFDENKVFISEQNNVRPAIADIPSNAKYIKFTITKNQYNTYLVQGDGIVICYVDSDIAIEPEMLVSKIPLPNVSIPYIDDYVNENNNRLNKTFALIGSEIPDYWNGEVQDAINKVENTMEDISSHGDAFIFLTDMHYPSNYGMSTKLAKYIARHSSVGKIVFGGDIMNTATTKVEAASYLRRIKNEFNGFDFSGIVGNHDANSNAVSDTSLHLGDDCLYSNFIYPNNDKLVSNGELYYYRDNDNAKIRFLYLNTGKASQVISASQLEWMVSSIAELDSDWSVVIIAHEIWNAWNDGNPTLHPSGQNIIETINDQYNLFKCNILAIVSGHTHFDYSVKDSHGYWIICSTCDANGANARVDPVNPTRTQGTTSEQAFDIFLFDATSRKIKAVRVGAGEDRTFE